LFIDISLLVNTNSGDCYFTYSSPKNIDTLKASSEELFCVFKTSLFKLNVLKSFIKPAVKESLILSLSELSGFIVCTVADNVL
jgi:hypothetical protein